MKTAAPNGYFAEGLLIYGTLEKGGIASKGFLLQPPDLRGGSVAQLNAYQDKIRSLLAALWAYPRIADSGADGKGRSVVKFFEVNRGKISE
ncbi:hypothetical protein M2447_002640, partial [Ereboglobus sp. PH5-10]|uniref:hypothetical protein n=1 Tax=Ereboglobus sp. PH5-10 TaxID=2940629 RepID=UPI002404B069